MDTENKEVKSTDQAAANDASVLADTLEKVSTGVDELRKQNVEFEKRIEELSKPRYPHGVPNGAPHIRTGEDPLTSRPYSMLRLAKALAMRASNDMDWSKNAKVELELSNDLRKAYYDSMSFQTGNILVPLGTELMPTHPTELSDGTKVDGLPTDLVRKCRDLMAPSLSGFDPDEYEHLAKRGVLRKDLSAVTATTGGTLVGLASQGELIEQLKAMEVMSQVGATQIDLPPQGRIRFPRQTSSVTIAAQSEGATVSESTPATSALELTAKPYSGLVDIPDELLRFSTSVAVEAWLRTEFLRELALKTDRDMIYGAGGIGIQGIVNYSGIKTVLATGTGATGDTLAPQDPVRLFAAIADANAPVDRGFFFAMTHTLWGGLSTRRANSGYAAANDSLGPFVFSALTQMVGGGRPQKSLNGYPVICSTQIPADRVESSATTLTLLLGGVGPEWIIARAGVAEIVVTNSDASKFQTRLSTMRGTVYMDAGPRHEESFGMIDVLLNS